jgi:hypothetical protein
MATSTPSPEELASMEEAKRPTKKELETAKAACLKKTDTYVKLEFNYNRVVVPHGDALKILDALKNAEQYDYSNDAGLQVITPINHSSHPVMSVMSQQEYLDLKMTNLFGIKIQNT